jgi:hypothetical protein
MEIPAALADEALAEAVATRERYGLRADEAWIRIVAADPASDIGMDEYGIPLTPEEFADLMSRRWDPDLHARVSAYCQSVDEDCAGAYINQKASGVIVELSDNVEQHVEALTRLVVNPRLLEVHEVEWSLADLARFTKQVESDIAWLEKLGVEVMGVDRSIIDNFIQVRYFTPAARADAIGRAIEQRFGNPTWLEARWVGPPYWEGPRATLAITVFDKAGRRVPNVLCDLESEHPEAPFDSATPIGTGPNGICELENLPAVAYKVTLRQWVDNDHHDRRALEEFRVVVDPSGTSVEVVVEPRQ